MGTMEKEYIREIPLRSVKYVRLEDIPKVANPCRDMNAYQYTAWEIAESLVIRCENCRWYDDREKMCYYHHKPMNYFDFCSRGREIHE